MSKEHREKIRLAAIERHAARKAAESVSPPPVVKVEPPVVLAAKPVDPTPVSVTPTSTPPPVISPASTGPAPILQTPTASPAVDPRNLFKAWLRTAPGNTAVDRRISTDPVRFASEIEDRVMAGWLAGFNAGRELL